MPKNVQFPVALGFVLASHLASSAAAERSIFACTRADGEVALFSPDGMTSPREGRAEQCRSVTLPLPLSSVRGVYWLSNPLPGDTDRIVLEGTGRGEAFIPTIARTLRSEREPSRPAPLPIGLQLISGLAAKPFGVEERVSITRTEDRINLTCRAGSKPAGLVLDPGPRRLPDKTNIKLRWETQGDRGFGAAFATRDGSPSAPVPLASAGSVKTTLPSNEEVRAKPWFVLSCPMGAGSLSLVDLRLAPEIVGTAPVSRAAWAWKPDLWRSQPEALLGQARDLGLDRLFVAVDIREDKIDGEDAFARFVAQARRQGVAITVVEGDPSMALEAGRATALRRLSVLAGYQGRVEPQARIIGLQYDIEPYLLSSYALHPERVLKEWAETIEALGGATSLELDMVLPFWLADDPIAAGLVLPALRVAKRVTVMAYRTDQAELQAAAEPLLAWGARAGIPVHVAVEAGPLEDETNRVYVRAPLGELWIAPQRDGDLALLLDSPRPGGSDAVFAFHHEGTVSAARLSFLGDEKQLQRVIEAAVPIFRSWTSFAGLAFHGIIE